MLECVFSFVVNKREENSEGWCPVLALGIHTASNGRETARCPEPAFDMSDG